MRLLSLSSPSWPEIVLLIVELTDAVRDHYLISASFETPLANSSLCCTWTCLSTRLVLLLYMSAYKSCAVRAYAALHIYACFCAALGGCLSTRACVAFVRARLCCTWRVSVYKSLCCICTCAFVLQLEGVCQKELILHNANILYVPTYKNFCASPGRVRAAPGRAEYADFLKA